MRANYFYLLCSLALLISCVSISSCDKNEVDPNIIKDIDGNEYSKVQIGTQVWMGENLNTSKLNDGTSISLVEDRIEWTVQHNIPAYCYFTFGNINYGETYGALYNWHAVNTGKLCPEGWHVPSESDWNTLADFLGGADIAGGKMKEIEFAHWDEPNKGATDESGFTALPSGYRHPIDGYIYNVGETGGWWSKTYSSSQDTTAWIRYVHFNDIDLESFAAKQVTGQCVRCIQD